MNSLIFIIAKPILALLAGVTTVFTPIRGGQVWNDPPAPPAVEAEGGAAIGGAVGGLLLEDVAVEPLLGEVPVEPRLKVEVPDPETEEAEDGAEEDEKSK